MFDELGCRKLGIALARRGAFAQGAVALCLSPVAGRAGGEWLAVSYINWPRQSCLRGRRCAGCSGGGADPAAGIDLKCLSGSIKRWICSRASMWPCSEARAYGGVEEGRCRGWSAELAQVEVDFLRRASPWSDMMGRSARQRSSNMQGDDAAVEHPAVESFRGRRSPPPKLSRRTWGRRASIGDAAHAASFLTLFSFGGTLCSRLAFAAAMRSLREAGYLRDSPGENIIEGVTVQALAEAGSSASSIAFELHRVELYLLRDRARSASSPNRPGPKTRWSK